MLGLAAAGAGIVLLGLALGVRTWLFLQRAVTESGSSSHPGAQAGDVVPVKYDPAKPSKGRMGTPFRLWGLPNFLVLLGLILGVAGLSV